MFFSCDLMKFNLLDDGKLCFEAESDDSEEAEVSETTDEVDYSVKTYFEKIVVAKQCKILLHHFGTAVWDFR